MRIIHVAPFYHPVIGGVEEVVKKIAEYMAFRGAEVYVLTYNRLRCSSSSLSREEAINNVRVVRLRPDIVWSHGTYSTELPNTLRKLKPDIVHVHAWRHPHVFQVAKLKERLGFKAVLHGHAPFYNLDQLGFVTWTYHRIVDLIKKNALKKYDSVIAISPYEKYVLTKKLRVNEDKIVIIPNGIDDELIKIAEKSRDYDSNGDSIILYVGRLCREKNIGLLVKAVDYAIKEIKTVRLILAGPDEGMWNKLLRYQKTSSIKYVGSVNRNAKLQLYVSSKIFANPATYEGFGITLLEAQAFGKPCVITGNGGQVYTAPPSITSLHTKPNPKDFGEAISLLLSDEELYKKLSANAKKWASHYAWSRMLPKYEEVYD